MKRPNPTKIQHSQQSQQSKRKKLSKRSALKKILLQTLIKINTQLTIKKTRMAKIMRTIFQKIHSESRGKYKTKTSCKAKNNQIR